MAGWKSLSPSDTDETTSLLSNTDERQVRDVSPGDTSEVQRGFGIIAVLLIGAFVSNTDSSLVIATYGTISSEFNRLERGRWLVTASMLASCALQPICYGKLTNIYGRKEILLLCYLLFVVVGRVLSGTGAAGMVSLVSILISDLVPMKEVASYRSYVNVVSTTGRSIAHGAILLTTSIVACLLSIDLCSKAKDFSNPQPIIAVISCVLLLTLFVLAESFWAKEPIFPLILLRGRDSVTCYATLAPISGAQLTLMSMIPLYFQITKKCSPGEAGTYLISAVVGNTLGGVATGVYIRRRGRYKILVILATLWSMTAYSLLIIRWRGHTNMLESLYIFGGGAGMGISYSALFIALAASLTEEEFPIAGSRLYMFMSIGSATGISVSGTIFKRVAKKGLLTSLSPMKNGVEIVHKALEDINYINGLSSRIHKLVVSSYLVGFRASFTYSLISASLASILSLTLREYKLRQ
ncbi:major facilitator superfamily domain-containing protein [Amylocarpus encephaloides]|uniref:Major facilitator superfamily domain-containing protein n=1 Tax=Amylocarpus encephaloides TaxID=45428 RepID=A0A9P7YP42_9HELO|nr:major facilitator superfamily domain-containing protein [Amylocarpus encephaloides]